jgi:predicted metal-dependent hydrolase
MNNPDVIEQPAAPTPVACSDLLGEARVAAVNGYMGDRRSLVEALEKLSSYYNTHEKNREWLVAEITRIDESVSRLLASPNTLR